MLVRCGAHLQVEKIFQTLNHSLAHKHKVKHIVNSHKQRGTLWKECPSDFIRKSDGNSLQKIYKILRRK